MNRSILSRIVLATDFSESAVLAQEYAAHLASTFGASIDILHVADGQEMTLDDPFKQEPRLRSQLKTVETILRNQGVHVTVRCVAGDPATQILAVAREVKADVIAMGLQGPTDVAYGVIGQTVNRVTQAGLCPVLTVPVPQRQASPCLLSAAGPVTIRRILAPVDFSALSMMAADYAVHLARRLGAELMVVHVLEPAHAGWGRTRTEAEARTRILREARLKEWTVEASAGDLVARYDIREGLAVDSILAGALQHRCDLIVMGTHGRGRYDRGQIGSIACGVLKQATCPVLTVSQIPVFLQSHPVSTTAGLQPQDAARGD